MARPFDRSCSDGAELSVPIQDSDLYADDQAVKTIFVQNRATAKHLRKSKLVITEGSDVGKELIISKERISVGRSIINDLVLTDKAVSGSHFEITTSDGGHILRDLDSTNGIYYGDLRVREIFLKPGTVFRVGNTKLKFQPLNEVVQIPLSEQDRFDRVIGQSVKMREIFATLEKVAPSELTVLVQGETGTGKELIAQAVHNHSHRRSKPFVVLDCSAIPRDLIESTLFGHEKGSFTGAIAQHRGCFEQANGGTIFLDEIGELDIGLQPKLLRVLENRELKRVGSDKTIKIDVRVCAATNRDLRAMINESTFREDLYFRLSVIHIELPPLRERKEDIAYLVSHFLKQVAAKRWKGEAKEFTVTPDAMETILNHHWSGNVRELKNVVERAASLSDGPELTKADFVFQQDGPSSSRATPPAGDRAVSDPLVHSGLTFKEAKQRILDAFESSYLGELLVRNNYNITKSAQEAGLTRYHLRELLKRHNLTHGGD
jgi:transcriptional regulator with GAF, ATPase, and Fis domain